MFDIRSINNTTNNQRLSALGIEIEDTFFAQQKKEVIKKCINDGLNQAITYYDKNNTDGIEYKLPVLSEDDWEQALSNISIITFAQGIPIGLKQYNNYAIATSTTNKEYVSPSQIYLSKEGSDEYHLVGCEKLTTSLVAGDNIEAYRSIDFKTRSFIESDGTVKYYIPRSQKYGCYYCIVDRSKFYSNIVIQSKLNEQLTAWINGLYHERYQSHEFLDNEYALTSLTYP